MIQTFVCYLIQEHHSILAKKAKEIGATFVTYSTDFVFDGDIRDPYTEEDMPNPPSVYAKSKRMGEEAVLAEYDKSFVIRTSWVFGIANNLISKLLIGVKQEMSLIL